MNKYKTNYKRKTITTAFSLPIKLLDEVNATLMKDNRFRTRSELAVKLFSDYVQAFNERDFESER